MEHYTIYRRGLREGNKVALTFDDGPNPPRTEQVLEILAQAEIQATFFVLGKWVECFPETVRRIMAAGHLIGNHGYAGLRHISDYDRAEAAIGHLTGCPSLFFRAHYFDYDNYFQSRVSTLPESRVIDADIRSSDWRLTDADEVVERVLKHPDLASGSIINLHDGGETDDTAIRLQRPLPMIAALKRIIDGLIERNLRCVRLDELELTEVIEWPQRKTNQ